MKKKTGPYKCYFPGCEYKTAHRSKIDFHHVTPREIDPSPRNQSTIPLCKTHHALIFHPQAKFGQHSVLTEASLQILAIYDSTAGKALHYESASGRQFYYYPDTGEISD